MVLSFIIHNISLKHDRETTGTITCAKTENFIKFYFQVQFLGSFRYEAKAVCLQICHVNDIQVFMGRKSTFYL